MLKVITINLNGVRAAGAKGFFSWARKQNADFICVQELKIHEQELLIQLDLEKNLPGYSAYFSFAHKKGYSGVGVFTPHKPQSIEYQLSFPLVGNEGRYVELSFPGIAISSIYLPSGTSGDERQSIKMHFLLKYQQHLIAKLAQGKSFIVCGDFNIAHKTVDLKNWQANSKNSGFLPEERNWLDVLFNELGLVDAFRVVNQDHDQYTWWTYRSKSAWLNNVGWRIDYQVTTPDLRTAVKSAHIYKELRFSDHAPLIIDYDLNAQDLL